MPIYTHGQDDFCAIGWQWPKNQNLRLCHRAKTYEPLGDTHWVCDQPTGSWPQQGNQLIQQDKGEGAILQENNMVIFTKKIGQGGTLTKNWKQNDRGYFYKKLKKKMAGVTLKKIGEEEP